MRWGAIVVWGVVVGCSPAAKPAPTPTPPASVSASEKTVQPVAADGGQPVAAAPSRLRLVRASERAELRSGRVEGIGAWFATGSEASAEVELDASDTGRVRLGPNTQLWAFDGGSLLLVSGRVRAQVLPDAPRPGRDLLRLATPQGTLRVPGTAEFWASVRSSKDRAFVQLQLMQGEVELLRPEQPPLLLTIAQGAYGSLPLQVGVSRTDVEALAALAKAAGRAREKAALAEADRRLLVQLHAYTELRARGAQLIARVSPSRAQKLPDAGLAWKPRNTEEIRAYQRDLAEYARAKHATSELLLLAAERSFLATLIACPAPREALDCPGVERWGERFSGLRGLVLDPSAASWY